ncbi:MAG: sulfite exporter TauE/SafE family protein, partial [Deltaproteobacteria bacterium]|nr:sulfite exporter TauE/SafE family protein [Deltaproteobacteria bacterium]
MSALEISLLIAVGLVAGVVNTLAGGGSLLTVPLLV